MPDFTFWFKWHVGLLPDEFTPRLLHMCSSQVGVPGAWGSASPGVVFALHFSGLVYLIWWHLLRRWWRENVHMKSQWSQPAFQWAEAAATFPFIWWPLGFDRQLNHYCFSSVCNSIFTFRCLTLKKVFWKRGLCLLIKNWPLSHLPKKRHLGVTYEINQKDFMWNEKIITRGIMQKWKKTWIMTLSHACPVLTYFLSYSGFQSPAQKSCVKNRCLIFRMNPKIILLIMGVITQPTRSLEKMFL